MDFPYAPYKMVSIVSKHLASFICRLCLSLHLSMRRYAIFFIFLLALVVL